MSDKHMTTTEQGMVPTRQTNKNKMNDSTVTTTDFYLAAYLLANNHRLAGHIRANGKSEFHFEGDGINELLNDFYQDRATVSPMSYAKTIRELKSLMYNGTNFNQLNKYDNCTTKKGSE
jgi:hypothetical protein